jgi:transcription elongation factor GreA
VTQRQQYLTPQGRDQLQEELHELRTVRRPDVASRIHQATEGGGTVDNAEYEEVKNEQAFVEGRIRDLEQILTNAVVAERSPDYEDQVQFGSAVTVKTRDGRNRHYRLVGSAEARPLDGNISNESPVGQALLDRRVGDVVDVETPSGVQTLTIVAVD